MSIPSVPLSQVKLIDENGELHPQWRIYFDQLTLVLQDSLANTGYKVPSKTTDQINNLMNINLTGRLLYNREQKNVQLNTEGDYKPASTYEELSTAGIDTIPSGQRNGRMIYDTTENSLKIGANDQFFTVTTID